MKLIKSILSLALALSVSQTVASAQQLRMFNLPNGLSVYVWEDHSKPDVYGEVAVRTGSYNDPEQYTGLAHYLEHVMFKGTQKIGALDWAQEEPIYNEIIAKYDQMADETDPARKKAIADEINALTVKAAKLGASNEYSNLIESIGGTSLNAATSFDQTFYFNFFPSNQIAKWLTLSSERFINPVFRAFQSELETVYEEYNMNRDNAGSQESEFILGKLFEGQPYARTVIGLGEHLKNPRLSELIKFYKTWYVPSNMALILVGDVDTKSIVRLISSTYGRIPAGPEPQAATYKSAPVKGRVQYTAKLAQMPSVVLSYEGVPAGHPDEIPLSMAMDLLSNTMNTGLLDALTVDGTIMYADASLVSFARDGRCIIQAVPHYDSAQKTYESSKKLEKRLLAAVEQLSSGDIQSWALEALKECTCRDFNLSMESSMQRASFIREIFINRKDPSVAMDYNALVRNVTLDDIKRVAKQYLTKDYIVIYSDPGKPDKGEKMQKPGYEPIKPEAGATSAYATWFKNMAAPAPQETFVDWSTVQERQINDYSRLYYTKNEENDVFSLVLRYGAGSEVFPKLPYAASLMDNAGIMGSFTPSQLKEQMARIGVTITMQADREYFYVTMRGHDASLIDACRLLSQTLMLPHLEESQIDNLKGSVLSSRYVRKNNVNVLSNALFEYVMYGDESSYRKEVSDHDVFTFGISELTSSISKAAGYAADIFYSGLLSFEDAYTVLNQNLPLVQGEKESKSPSLRKMRELTENTVFFLPNTDTQQAKIFFYMPLGEYNRADNVASDAFNCYFGGGFNGILLQQIREYNSMAYTASGAVSSRKLPGSATYYTGYVGTQNDKAIEAVRLYMSLLRDMPQNPGTIDNIRNFLYQTAFTSRPDFRDLSMQISDWKQEGYTEDPAKEELPGIKALTFEDIVAYYDKHIKGAPVAIGIIGNPKDISVKALSEFGKVIRLNEKQLFNEEDTMF